MYVCVLCVFVCVSLLCGCAVFAKLTLSSPERLAYAAPWQVRFVIGSGGATINTIRQETSTFIKSDRNEADPSAPVVFRIEGHSAEGVEAARVRIQEIVGMCVLHL